MENVLLLYPKKKFHPSGISIRVMLMISSPLPRLETFAVPHICDWGPHTIWSTCGYDRRPHILSMLTRRETDLASLRKFDETDSVKISKVVFRAMSGTLMRRDPDPDVSGSRFMLSGVNSASHDSPVRSVESTVSSNSALRKPVLFRANPTVMFSPGRPETTSESSSILALVELIPPIWRDGSPRSTYSVTVLTSCVPEMPRLFL